MSMARAGAWTCAERIRSIKVDTIIASVNN
jgi:hypothetical protein